MKKEGIEKCYSFKNNSLLLIDKFFNKNIQKKKKKKKKQTKKQTK